MKKLKYGIIGLGGVATGKFIPGYASHSDEVELVAACNTNKKKLEYYGRKFNIPRLCKDYREILAMEDVDFVAICSPNLAHKQQTIEALRSGKHVHLEKPMCMNPEEAGEMIAARNETGKKFMLALNNRFTPHALFLKKYIDEGNLGGIYFARCGWLRRRGIPHMEWWTERSRSGGGVLIDLGVHFIDQLLYYMNFPKVRSVVGRTYSKFAEPSIRQLYSDPRAEYFERPSDIEDLAAGFIELENDASLMFEYSYASNIEEEKVFYEIYGTKGGIRVTSGHSTINADVRIFTLVNGRHVDIAPQITRKADDETEFRHFLRCIRENTVPTIATPEQGMQMMTIINAIYQSEKLRKQIVF